MTRPLPDLEAWAVLARIAETGSFSAAADDLGTSKGSVSKTVARLEARLGTTLLHRTSRRVALTEAGRLAAARGAQILAEAEAAEAEAASASISARGLVRLAAPMSFGLRHVAPRLPDLLAAHPGLEVDLQLDDELVDLIAGGFDFALRIAALPDSTLRVRRICQVRRLLVGSPDYFTRHGEPTHPSDLARHACLGYTNLPGPGRWAFVHEQGEQHSVAVRGPLRTNNADGLMPSLLAGLGLAVQPEFLIWDELSQGRLRAVLRDWSLPAIALNVVAPPARLRPARVTLVIDELVRMLGAAPWSHPVAA